MKKKYQYQDTYICGTTHNPSTGEWTDVEQHRVEETSDPFDIISIPASSPEKDLFEHECILVRRFRVLTDVDHDFATGARPSVLDVVHQTLKDIPRSN